MRNLDEVEAKSRLEGAGFVVERMGTTDPTPDENSEHKVQGQLPSAGVLVPAGSKVRIFIYGVIRVIVPDVLTLDRETAESAITASRLVPVLDFTVHRPPGAASEFTVEAQDPPPGKEVDRNTPVVITIYGAAGPMVPDVRKMRFESAVATLEAAGLSIARVTRGGVPAPSPELTGLVASQSPVQGSRIPAEQAQRGVHITTYGPPPNAGDGEGGKQDQPGDQGGLLGMTDTIFEGTGTASDGTAYKVIPHVTRQPDGSAKLWEETTGARWTVPGAGDHLLGRRGQSVHFTMATRFSIDATISGDKLTGNLSSEDPDHPPAEISWRLDLRRRK